MEFLDDTYVVSEPERTRPIINLLAEKLFQGAGIRLHEGKTRVWNRGGECPADTQNLGPDVWSPDGIKILGNNRQQQAPTGTNRHQQAPTGTNRHQQAPTGTNRQQQATTGNNRQQQATTRNNRQQQGTTGNNKEQQATTRNNRQQQGTTGNNKEQQATTRNNNNKEQATSNNNNNTRKFGQNTKTLKLAKCGLAKCGHENDLAKFGFFCQMRFGQMRRQPFEQW